MNEDVRELGLTLNSVQMMGRVMSAPTFQNEDWAFFDLTTTITEFGTDNTYVTNPTIIHIMTNKPSMVKTIKDYIQTERQLVVTGSMKTWIDGNGVEHTHLIPNNIRLGPKTIYRPDNN